MSRTTERYSDGAIGCSVTCIEQLELLADYEDIKEEIEKKLGVLLAAHVYEFGDRKIKNEAESDILKWILGKMPT